MISLVIPVFNERDSLPQLLREIHETGHTNGLEFEVLFINDGSTDDSWDVIRELAAQDPRVRGIRFRRNFGKAAALVTGGAGSLFLRGNARGVAYAAFSAAGFACLGTAAISVLLGGGTVALAFALPFPVGFVSIAIDPLSAFFVLMLALSNFTAAFSTLLRSAGLMAGATGLSASLASEVAF